MLAEKNDWVPRTVAPFIWLNRETTSGSATSSETSQMDEVKANPEIEHSKTEQSNQFRNLLMCCRDR